MRRQSWWEGINFPQENIIIWGEYKSEAHLKIKGNIILCKIKNLNGDLTIFLTRI